MSTINGKLGLKAAGKRSMMKLPEDRALRNKVTAAQCPACGQRGANLSKAKTAALTPWLVCGWCSHTWQLPT